MKLTGIGQPMLCNHFAANYGMPYKYIANDGTTSIAFSEAPDAITGALRRVRWAAKKVVPAGEFKDPNELLAIAYMRDNEMGYHNDDETGLGPTVGSLSLGGDATMYVRLQTKYYKPSAMKMANIARYDPKKHVFPGSLFWKERIALNAKHGGTCHERWENEKLALFRKFAGIKGGNSQNAKPCLEIVLKHGDYLIQHGDKLQKYFEVCHFVFDHSRTEYGRTLRLLFPPTQ